MSKLSRVSTLGLTIVTFLLAAAPLESQTKLYLRYGAGPKLTITGASNSTPIRITTGTPHGFNNGDVIWIWGIEGNTNANGTRIVKSVEDATHFTIQYVNKSDAAGNGAFAPATRIGAWCGSTVGYNLTSHPRLWFDGPNGPLTSRMKDPDGAGGQTAPRAQTGNAPWDAMSAFLDNNIGSAYQWNGANFGEFRNGSHAAIAAMALRWFGDNSKTIARDGAIHWIQNAERIAETLACDESAGGCGDPTDIDYAAGYYVTPLAEAYTLMHGQLSASDISRFAGMMLNDITDGGTCTPMYTAGTGTVISATSAGVMMGSGTNWLSSLAPGDAIYPAGYNPWVVVSVDSNTQLHYRTANLPGANFSGSFAYKIAKPWKTGNCGWSFFAKHSGYSVLSPELQYPPQGGILLADLFGNQFLTKTAAFLNVGLATADDDPRGARLAESAANWFQDVGFPLYQKYWTGPTQIDSQYGPDRFGQFMVDVVWGLYNSTGGAVNYLAGNWLKNRALFNIYEWLPTSDAGAGKAYGIGYGISNEALRDWARTLDPAELSQLYASTPQGQQLNYFMRNVRGDFNSTAIRSFACYACPAVYAFTDPSYSSTDYRSTLPTSMAFIHTDAESTSPTTNTSMIIDRTGFTSPSDTLLHIMAVDIERDTNHLSNSSNGTFNPASYSIYKNHQLLGEDSGSGVQTANGYTGFDSKSMYMEVGGAMTLKDADGMSVFADVQVSRYADGGAANQNKYMYALVDSAGAYQPSAALSRMHRHFLDFKGGGSQFILVYDDVASTGGRMKRTYLHYPNNGQSGEGSTTFSQGSNSVTSMDGGGGSMLLTKVLFPGAPGFTYVDNANGSYAGGQGQTFRVSVCAGSGTTAAGCDGANSQAEFLVIHMPVMNQSASMPAVSVISGIDTNFRGVRIDGGAPKIALFARNGVLQKSVAAFSTNQSGTIQIVVAGLSAGHYLFYKDGAVLTGVDVVDGDNTLYVESTAGTFSISQGTGGGTGPGSGSGTGSGGLSAPTNVTATTISSSQIYVAWAAGSGNTGVTGYRVYRDGTMIATVSTPAYSDTNLTASTTYSYTIAAVDGAGNQSAQSAAAIARTLAAPVTLSPPANVTATAKSSTQIDVAWGASAGNSGVTGYKVFRNGGLIATVSAPSYSDSGLTPATTYSYTVAAVDGAGNASSQSAAASAKTQAAPVTLAPPANVTATAVSSTQINVSWAAGAGNSGVTGYKVFRNGGLIGTVNALAYSDSGLTPATTYSYTVAAMDGAGNVSDQSAAASAKTQAAPVTLAPPANVTATAVSSTQINVSWAAGAGNSGVTGYKVFRNGGLIGTVNALAYSDSGLTPATTYSYTVAATDGAGNVSDQSAAASAKTQAAPVTLAPPANVTATAKSSTQIDLAWAAGAGNSGVTGYKVFRNGGLIATVSALSYSDSGLTPATTYSYTVAATDGAGNVSDQSAAASAKTQAAPVTLAPPANVTATAVSSTQINVSWAAGAGNSGVTGYKVFRNGGLIATVNALAYSDSGLTPATTYSYTVAAADGAGNVSDQSAAASAKTQAAPVALPTPANLTATPFSSTQISLSWTPGSANAAVTGYRVYRNGALITTIASTSYTDSNLTPATSYSYTVAAVDGGGNASSPCSAVSATTLAAPTLPTLTPPAGVTATALSSTQISVSWTAGSSGVTVANYRVYRNGALAGVVSALSYADSNLTPSTTYTYAVASADALGNVSSQSAAVSATTLAAAPAAGPSAVSVTPNTGSGSTQTFKFVYADPRGYSNITSVLSMVNASMSTSGGCFVLYHPEPNLLYLANDGGTSWSAPVTLGQSGTAQNSQCAIDAATSSAKGSANNLTLELSVTFHTSFGGTKAIYSNVSDGTESGWQQLGSWTVPTGPAAPVSVTPASGSGGGQTFRFVYSSPKGYGSLTSVAGIINSSATGAGGCYFLYYPYIKFLYLSNDGNSAWTGPVSVGQAGTLENSQCAINAAGSSDSGAGSNLTLNLAISFKASFAGARNIYLSATDWADSGWKQLGTWTVTTSAPMPVSVAPASGAGGSQVFEFSFSDPKGYTALTSVSALINSSTSAAEGCLLIYYPSSGALYLANDSATGLSGAVSPGQYGALQNSQCTVNAAGSSVSGAGSTLSLNVAISFKGAFAGAKGVYLDANDGADSGWQKLGDWYVLGSGIGIGSWNSLLRRGL